MSKKGQQYKKYSNSERIEIVMKYLNNEATPTMLSKEYNISIKTIWNWITKYNIFTRIPQTCRRLDIILQHN